jgi:hypothetical protein
MVAVADMTMSKFLVTLQFCCHHHRQVLQDLHLLLFNFQVPVILLAQDIQQIQVTKEIRYLWMCWHILPVSLHGETIFNMFQRMEFAKPDIIETC